QVGVRVAVGNHHRLAGGDGEIDAGGDRFEVVDFLGRLVVPGDPLPAVGTEGDVDAFRAYSARGFEIRLGAEVDVEFEGPGIAVVAAEIIDPPDRADPRAAQGLADEVLHVEQLIATPLDQKLVLGLRNPGLRAPQGRHVLSGRGRTKVEAHIVGGN